MEYNCIYCSITFKRNCDLSKHKITQKCNDNKKRYIEDNETKKKIILIETELNIYKNKDMTNMNKIMILENNLILLKKHIEEKDIQLKLIEDKYEDLRKIVEKAATKTTNTVKNYTHNNYLNYISAEPLRISEFPKQLKHIVNCDTVMYDDNDFHDHIVDNILKDKSGKDKVLCTDINRKNFTYKDETSGELISDPELEKLRNQLKKGTNIRQIRKDLLDKLVTEYEDNGCIGIDPYKQFSEIIQKLNFGTPFVDHVAKKTYVKTKSNNTNEHENTNDTDENWNTEEYQKLLEEFGEECDN
jgi:hypothetical protein|uniref:Uncharacterized protein n=1 Tax=viral metagenome TaxID=1070528 RepID=A0A6C0I6N6_9ZZZZ